MHHASGIGSVILEPAVHKMTTCCKNKLSWGGSHCGVTAWFGSTYFQTQKLCQQKERISMKSTQSPVVSHIYTAHFKEMALDVVKYKPSLWLHYVGNTLMV